jgi:hypothetical protein
MTGGMSMGSVLGMMGSVPVTKSADVIINKLKAAKTLEAGDVSGLQNSNLMNGLKGLMQSPASKGGNAAKNSAGQASAELTQSNRGQETLNTIQTGLIQAIDDVVTEAGELVGIGEDPQALITTISTSSTLATLSQADPAAHGLPVLLGPALADDVLLQIADDVGRIAHEVAMGLRTDNDGAVAVSAMASELLSIISRSQQLRSLADAQSVYLASVSALSGLLSGGPPEWRTAIERALYPEPLAKIQEANREFMSVE